ncbi:MAG: hypothetical protein E6J89_17970 [Deltaproteobacteria bacterium]|nr:MAG: hypothetical protein E6J89_17970 [Deltaproteobacteria bacterium]
MEEEISTIKKYLELAGILYRVEIDNAKLASLSSQILTDEKGASPLLGMDVPDPRREISLKRDKRFQRVGLNAFEALEETLIEAVWFIPVIA